MFDTSVSGLLNRPVRAVPELPFTTESGRAILEDEFLKVTFKEHDMVFSFPDAGTIVAYLDSIREPIVRNVDERFDFDAALDDVTRRIEQVMQSEGHFRTTSRSGVFIWR
jgi:hypothetical protein